MREVIPQTLWIGNGREARDEETRILN